MNLLKFIQILSKLTNIVLQKEEIEVSQKLGFIVSHSN